MNMNLKYALRNLYNSVRLTGSPIEAIKYIILSYEKVSVRLGLRKTRIKIKYNLPEPLGKLKLFHRFNNGADCYIFSEIFLKHGYDIDLSKAPTTILDLGANVGYASIFFKKKYPNASVACIEPMPNNISVLKDNIKVNHLEIAMLEGAVSTEDEDIYMTTGTKDYDFKVTVAPVSSDLKVTGYTIEKVMKLFGWNQIDLLKVDIEGYEKNLFAENCDWLYKVNNILLEVHYPFYTQRDVEYLVAKYSFSGFDIIDGLFLIKR